MTRVWWSVLMILITAVALVAINMAYTARSQREADKRWCALLTSLDAPQVPPTTERGRQVQSQIHELRRSLGCGGAR